MRYSTTGLSNRASIRELWLTYQAFALAAMVVLNFTIAASIEIGAAVAGTAALLATRLTGSWPEPQRLAKPFALGAVGLMLAFTVVMAGLIPHIVWTYVYVSPIVLVTLFLIWRFDVERRSIRLIAVGTLSAILLIIGLLWIPSDEPYTDMFFLHASAAEVMLDGRNPYTDAYSISTNPYAPEGSEYVGYAYPPLTMLPFAGSHIVLGDSRWASVIAMVLVVSLIIRPWEAMDRRQGASLIALALALVIQPSVMFIIFYAWTDMVTLPLLLAGALLWRRHPMLAAVLLGLAFGTKQYLVLALPVMLAFNDDYRWKRTVVAGGVAALTLLPFVLLDPVAFYNATIAGSLNAPIFLDSSGLAGRGVELPYWLVITFAIGVSIWMGHRGGGSARFLLSLAATLSIAFLVGYQAFINYWFLVGSVALLGVVTAVTEEHDQSSDRLLGAEPAKTTATTVRST